jgi:hypothetical protein
VVAIMETQKHQLLAEMINFKGVVAAVFSSPVNATRIAGKDRKDLRKAYR